MIERVKTGCQLIDKSISHFQPYKRFKCYARTVKIFIYTGAYIIYSKRGKLKSYAPYLLRSCNLQPGICGSYQFSGLYLQMSLHMGFKHVSRLTKNLQLWGYRFSIHLLHFPNLAVLVHSFCLSSLFSPIITGCMNVCFHILNISYNPPTKSF